MSSEAKVEQILLESGEEIINKLEKEWNELTERRKMYYNLHSEILYGVFVCDKKVEALTKEYHSLMARRSQAPLPYQSGPSHSQSGPLSYQLRSSSSQPGPLQQRLPPASKYVSKPANYFLVPDGSILNWDLKPLHPFSLGCIPMINKSYKCYSILQCVDRRKCRFYRKFFITGCYDPELKAYRFDWGLRVNSGFYLYQRINGHVSLTQRELLLLFFIDDTSSIPGRFVYSCLENCMDKLSSSKLKLTVYNSSTLYVSIEPHLIEERGIKKIALDSTLEYLAGVGIRGSIVYLEE